MTNNDDYTKLLPWMKMAQYSEEQTQNEITIEVKPRFSFRRFALPLLAALGFLVSGIVGAGVYMLLDKENEAIADSQESTVSTLYSNTLASSAAGDVISVVEKAAGSVVEISTEVKQVNPFTSQYVTGGAGSGVVLSADGYIVTNYHVIKDANTVTVTTIDGTKYTAVLVGTDQRTDLAVLKINASGLKPVEFADSSNIQVGQVAVAIGNPLGELGGTVTSGIISGKDREITIDGQNMTLLQTSAAVSPGNSGGGLFDNDGRLVGVVNSKSAGTGIEGLAFAIPSNTVQDVALEIIENGYVSGRPQLGISIVEISDSRTAMMYRVNRLGVYISAVSQSNGLAVGDLVVSIDGVEIETSADIRSILDKHSVGDVVIVEVQRSGGKETVSVTLTEQISINTQTASAA